MNSDINNIVDQLKSELKKDLPFFGTCGVVVGYFTVVHSRLKEIGVLHGDGWGNSLFSDFVSVNAFALVYVGLIAIGAITTIASSFGFCWPRLEAAVRHLETRLTQISSSIISFTAGLSVLALIHSGMTISNGGLALAFLVVLFNTLLFFGFFSAVLMARRIKPWGSLWGGVLALVMAGAMLALLIVYGTK